MGALFISEVYMRGTCTVASVIFTDKNLITKQIFQKKQPGVVVFYINYPTEGYAQ